MFRSATILLAVSLSGCGHMVAINTGITAVALGADAIVKVIDAATQIIEFGELVKSKTREPEFVPELKGEK